MKMTMNHNQAMVITAFGDADKVFAWREDLPMPEVGEGQSLVQVAYAGVNPVDYKSRMGLGWGAELFRPRLPNAVLGFDFSGTTADGERVCGANFNGGAYAHYLACDTALLARVPPEVALSTAAALPTAGVTALQLLRAAKVQAGERVLLSAPLGGVGHILLQLLAETGAEIVAIASQAKAEAVRQAGVHRVLCYDDNPHYADVEADVFLDLVGGEAAVAALPAVKQGGRVFCLPTIHVPKLQEAGTVRGLQVQGLLMQPNAQDLQALLTRIAEGKLAVNVAHVLPLTEVAKAHQLQETGRVNGKVILVVESMKKV